MLDLKLSNLEEIIGENIHDPGFDKGLDFFLYATNPQSIKDKIDKLDFIKIKTFC